MENSFNWINIDSKLEPVIDSILIAESQNQNNSNQKEIWGRISDNNGKSISITIPESYILHKLIKQKKETIIIG